MKCNTKKNDDCIQLLITSVPCWYTRIVAVHLHHICLVMVQYIEEKQSWKSRTCFMNPITMGWISPLCRYRAPARGREEGIFFLGGLQCIISRVWLLRFSYLIKFLEFYNLEENVLQDVLCVPLIFIQLWCHPQNFATFPYVEFKIIICACECSAFFINSLGI